jgi:hypothetical protein
MSFWSDPSASFEQLGKDPWHSMENFGTTGLVPMIPYVAGAIGGFFGGPAGAMAAGSAAQEGVDYFGGNSKARTGQGILGSITSGAGKGYLGSLGASYGGDWLSSLGGDSASSAGGGMLDSIGGNGGNFGGDIFQVDNSAGDVWGGWSPTGSSANGMGSGLGTSSSNPMAYNDPYAAQDVMQQARDTSVASGNPASWDTASQSSGGSLLNNKSFQQQLAKQLMKSNLGGSMQQGSNYRYQEQPIQRQGAFAPTPAPFQVQDKDSELTALIAALRSKGTI